MQTGTPACPSPDPITEHGDIIVVPGGMAGTPGTMTLHYEYLLEDLGMESLSGEEVRDLLHEAEGFHLDTLMDIDASIATVRARVSRSAIRSRS